MSHSAPCIKCGFGTKWVDGKLICPNCEKRDKGYKSPAKKPNPKGGN